MDLNHINSSIRSLYIQHPQRHVAGSDDSDQPSDPHKSTSLSSLIKTHKLYIYQITDNIATKEQAYIRLDYLTNLTLCCISKCFKVSCD